MSEVLIEVKNVSKRFCRNLRRSLWYGVKDIASELIGGRHRDSQQLRREEFWAVRNISFEVRRGECLGLIGHNGAGKSTLLKLLNGLIKPDHGTITMTGRVGALIELGAGFNPILTGRENIYINGQILGFSKNEIDERFNEIVEFAEIGDFIDTPVQNYSSGMKVRLGFAIASQMEPDILIIDEVLAVGDAGFRIKCFNSISKLARSSAIVFVSHVMPQVARVSDFILMLKNGTTKYYGKEIGKGIECYFDEFESEKPICYDEKISISSISVNSSLNGSNKITTGEDVNIKVNFINKIYVESLQVSFAILDKEVRQIAICNSSEINISCIGEHNLRTKIPQLMLSPGTYSLTLFFYDCKDAMKKEVIGYFRSVVSFKVTAEFISDQFASFILNGEWSLEH